MRFHAIGWYAAGFTATLLTVGAFDAASAQGYSRHNSRDTNYVVAESRMGNGFVRGPVRQTSLGPQVRLPGGSWIYCKRSCSETLRAETVDFWEARQGPGAQEQGLFIYLRKW